MADAPDPGEIEGLLRDLVAIPSVNPALGEGNEAAIARFAADWLRSRGLSAAVEEVEPGRANVHAEVGVGGPDLCLYGHLDTVSVRGMTGDPYGASLREGRVYGRGAHDMKGGVAAVMSAAAALAAAGIPRGRLSVALLCDEEWKSIGADAYVRRHHPDACILTEPTDGQLEVTHKGFIWLEVVTRGRAAHGSRWDLGVSAIAGMAPVVSALDAFDRDVLRRREAPLVGPASLHCALIEGGTGVSTYADTCRLQVERRLLPAEDPELASAEIGAVVRAACPDAEVRPYFARTGLVGDATTRVAVAVREAAAGVTGREPDVVGAGGWTDAAVFSAAGVPSVLFGASGAGAHETEEWADLASVVRLARILAEAARRFWG